ncbi:MAG: aminotransferase, partial [Chloroflexota bacterium]
MSYKKHYSRFLKGLGGKLHFAAHSHYPWPDRTREAALACWDDAAELVDAKWGRTLGPVLGAAQRSVAAAIGWPDPSCIAFAPNTHELVNRLLSCLPPNRPPRILTSDSEFHSFARQAARLEEDGAKVVRVPVEPFETFVPRLTKEAKTGKYDMVFVS